MDIPKRLESLHGLIISYISWEILYVCMQQSKRTPKVIKPLSAFVFLRLQRQLLVFTWTCKKITLKLLALIAPRKEKQIHIEVHQIWPVLYWSNCGQNFLQNQKLCRMMKKRPFSRVLSLKNGLFLVEVRRLELRASWSQTLKTWFFTWFYGLFGAFASGLTAFVCSLRHKIRVVRSRKWSKVWSATKSA